MFAAQHRLDNLTIIVDNNQISMLGRTDDMVSHRDLKAKFEAFGWRAVDVPEGHSVTAIDAALRECRASTERVPQAVIVNTLKGNRVPGLEDAPLSHVTAIKPDLIDELLEPRE